MDAVDYGRGRYHWRVLLDVDGIKGAEEMVVATEGPTVREARRVAAEAVREDYAEGVTVAEVRPTDEWVRVFSI